MAGDGDDLRLKLAQLGDIKERGLGNILLEIITLEKTKEILDQRKFEREEMTADNHSFYTHLVNRLGILYKELDEREQKYISK